MILQPKTNNPVTQKDIAYRCPSCGQVIHGFLGNFAHSADMLKLKCPCGESELVAKFSSDREKVRVEVPCLFCADGHQFTVSKSLFLGDRLFLLNCPYSRMDICFLGPKDEVESAVKTAEEELSTLLREFGAEKLSDIQPQDMDPEEVLPDARIYDIVRYVVKDLESAGEIECPCNSGEYEIYVTERGILVACPTCHASYLFRTDSVSAAEEFLKCEHLILSPAPDEG